LPTTTFSLTDYTYLGTELDGVNKPIIYGNWGTYGPQVPAFVVNSTDGNMNGGIGRTENVKLVISENANKYLTTSRIQLWRSGEIFSIDSRDILNVNSDNNYFEIKQDGYTTFGGSKFFWQTGDKFMVNVVGEDLLSYDQNGIAIAKDLLKKYGGLTDLDFDSTWTMMDKLTPATPENSISIIPMNLWIQDSVSVLEQALSLLEQLRVEMFISKDLKFSLSNLHFDQMEYNPSHTINQWDVIKESWQPSIDVKNNFNRAKATFCFFPCC